MFDDYDYDLDDIPPADEWLVAEDAALQPDDGPNAWKRTLFIIITLLTILAVVGTLYLPGLSFSVEQERRPPPPTPTALPRAHLPDSVPFTLS